MAFGKYVRAFRAAIRAMGSPPEKLQKERDHMKILKRNVSDRCRDGSTGVATAVYNFLTDSAGSKRTQGAMRFIKNAVSKVENPTPTRFVYPNPRNSRPYVNRRGSGGSGGSGGFGRPQNSNLRAVPANLKCFICLVQSG